MRIDRSFISNQNTYEENDPRCIVVHNTDNFRAGADARTHAEAQHNGELSNMSAHYYVDDGETAYQAAPHSRGCWHVGVNYGGTNLFGKYGNRSSIGVEMCVQQGYDYEKAFQNTVKVVKMIMSETGIPASRVYRHYDICSKHCPSQIMERGDWDRFKRLISGGASADTPKQPEKSKYEPGIYKVNDPALNIRTEPNADSKIAGVIRDQGSYTVTEIQNTSWGRLLSGAGWINCHAKYCTYGGAAPREDTKPAAKAISVDGVWGSKLTRRLQEIFGTPQDGRISNQPTSNREYCVGITVAEWSTKLSGGSALIRKLQEWAGITEDGYIGPQTIRALQRKLGTPVDGVISYPSAMVRALQEWCNRQ